MPTTITDRVVDLAKDYGASEDASAQTISEALDLLNDTLAGSDQAGASTISDALGALSGNIVPSSTLTITENGTGIDVAQYAAVDVAVSGGTSVGAFVPIRAFYNNDDVPAVGDYCTLDTNFNAIYIGESLVIESKKVDAGTEINGVAAGCEVTTCIGPAYLSQMDAISGYIVTLTPTEYGDDIIATIRPWDGTITTEWFKIDDDTYVPTTADDTERTAKRYVYTVPALDAGEALMLQYVYYWD